jgi:hypothetical protein
MPAPRTALLPIKTRSCRSQYRIILTTSLDPSADRCHEEITHVDLYLTTCSKFMTIVIDFYCALCGFFSPLLCHQSGIHLCLPAIAILVNVEFRNRIDVASVPHHVQ